MYKTIKILCTTFFIFILTQGRAQLLKESPKLFELGLIPALEIPLGDFSKLAKPAVGISLKGAYNLRSSDQITLRAGYTGYAVKDLPFNYSSTYSIVPILAGYRLGISKVFVEGQAGIGFYSLRVSNGTSTLKSDQTNFTYALCAGYDFGRIEFISRFQQGHFEGTGAGNLSILTFGLYFKFL